jgi:hypothetical protein
MPTAAEMLAGWEAAANHEFRLAELRMKWNTAAVDALGKLVKIEQDATKLRAMQIALVQYQRANADLLREIRQLQARVEMTHSAVKHAAWCERGEYLEPNNVRHVWVAFRWLLGQAAILGAKLSTIPTRALNGNNYAMPRYPEQRVSPAPRNATHPRALVEWLADQNAMPRVGSLAAEAVATVMRDLAEAIKPHEAGMYSRLEAMRASLLAVQQAGWKTVDFDVGPK